MNTKLTIQQIQSRGDLEGYTAYQIWRILNAAVTAESLVTKDGKPAWSRPQMVYNYAGKGMIAAGKKGMDARYTRDEVQAFVTKTIERLRNNQPTTEKILTSKDTAQMQSAARG